MPALEISAYGRVQGVGFRRYIQNCANRYDLKGYVQNRPDGSVLIIASGQRDRLDMFVSEIRQGNRFAQVSRLTVDELAQYSEYEEFFIA